MKLRTHSKTIAAIDSTRSTQTPTKRNTTWRRPVITERKLLGFSIRLGTQPDLDHPSRRKPCFHMNFVAEQNSRKECISFFFSPLKWCFSDQLAGKMDPHQKKQQEQGTPFDENIFWWCSKRVLWWGQRWCPQLGWRKCLKKLHLPNFSHHRNQVELCTTCREDWSSKAPTATKEGRPRLAGAKSATSGSTMLPVL